MTTPAQLLQTPDNVEALAAAGLDDGFAVIRAEADDLVIYAEIAERRARTENPDILRGARAL
jgi:hypothetical protein